MLTSKAHTSGARGRGQGPAGGCTRSGIGRCGRHEPCRETVPTGRPPALTTPKNASRNAENGAISLHLLCQLRLPCRSCTSFGNQPIGTIRETTPCNPHEIPPDAIRPYGSSGRARKRIGASDNALQPLRAPDSQPAAPHGAERATLPRVIGRAVGASIRASMAVR